MFHISLPSVLIKIAMSLWYETTHFFIILTVCHNPGKTFFYFLFTLHPSSDCYYILVERLRETLYSYHPTFHPAYYFFKSPHSPSLFQAYPIPHAATLLQPLWGDYVNARKKIRRLYKGKGWAWHGNSSSSNIFSLPQTSHPPLFIAAAYTQRFPHHRRGKSSSVAVALSS